jgi:hypothetical protein
MTARMSDDRPVDATAPAAIDAAAPAGKLPHVKVLACPSCRHSMHRVDLDRRLAGQLQVDLCVDCQAIWFDAYESVQLTPIGTLNLFREIHAAQPTQRRPLPARLPCPRCDTSLDPTQDLQRATRFTYFRCRRGHGRFTPFVQFLREKNFIRPIPPDELERLKKLVRVISCSSCGAPVDLERQAACGYCRAPIAVLDPGAVAQTLRELDAAAARRADIAQPEQAAAGILEAARFDRAMAVEQARDRAAGVDLVAVGLGLLASLVAR